MKSVVGHLRRAALLGGGGLTDGQLLEGFLARRDEAAFEALLRRHGPMVLGVCRRLLRHEQDAEDAFQATFLVLARKAAAVRPRDLVGAWLHGVAYRTAMKARTMAIRRREREKRAAVQPATEAPSEPAWEKLLPLLDQELSQLPDKYRVPVVLCDLEGRTRREVARQLMVPEGTVSSRLATARKLLARRLARHGLALSGAAVAAALSAKTVSACVTRALAASTAQAAVSLAAGRVLTAGAVPARVMALTEGVVKTMLLMKLRAVVAVGVVVLVGAGVVGLAYRTTASEPGQAATQPAADDLEALRLEVEALRKEMRVTRQELRDLKDEMHAPKREAGSGPAPKLPGAATKPLPSDLAVPIAPVGRETTTTPVPGTRSGVKEPPDTAPQTKKYWSVTVERAPNKPDGGDPLAEAEAALKKLREHPDDKEAADALARALHRVKEREKPPAQPGYSGEAK